MAIPGLPERLRAALVDEHGESRLQDPRGRVLAQFYAGRNYAPIWYQSPEPRERALYLLTALEQSERQGLDPSDYAAAALRRECLRVRPDDLVGCELRLSASLLRYAQDVGFGRHDPEEMDPDWFIQRDALAPLAVLDRMARKDGTVSTLEGLPPAHEGYRQLRAGLAAYRWLAMLGGWPSVPEGPVLQPGMTHEQVTRLRQRLAVEQPALAAVENPSYYDEELRVAVEHFQSRHGLEVDGIVGGETRAAMNVPIEERIAQIRLNMERWRWLPRDMGSRHLVVNIPAFDLALVENEDPVLRMRAITGRVDRTSPAFQSRVVRIVFNPDWTVPLKIAVEDILPHVRRDPGYLQRKHIAVLQKSADGLVEVDPHTVNWRRYHKGNFPFILRQAPGPQNSLGRLKFVMPSRFAIFIHDTPSEELFDKTVRTLSSGCIRIEKPVELAIRLLNYEDPLAAELEIQVRIEEGRTSELPVVPEVPVYLVYLTAWVDEEGNLQFRDDVYGRNQQLRDHFSFP